MIQELLYTSHQGAGLRKGTGGGFCTVLSTEGMAANLAMSLEKLSGYKHPFDIHDKRSQDNPVNCRHAIMRIGGITYHVLSRIADQRYEHTGRSNKLAHHVALVKDALPPCGPAAICQQPDFFRNEWDGKVRLEPARQPVYPPAGLLIKPCTNWQKVTGDAGWAGVVAEHVLNNPDTPISILFPLGLPTLVLVAEILTLLPPNSRWNTTFSTFFTTLPAGTSCNIRCILAETPEAEKLLRDHREKVINICADMGSATGSNLVNAARTGELQHAPPPPVKTRRGPARFSPVATERGEVNEVASSEFNVSPQSDPKTGFRAGSRAASTLSSQSFQATSSPKGTYRTLKVAAIFAVIGSIVFLMLLIAGIGTFFLRKSFKGALSESVPRLPIENVPPIEVPVTSNPSVDKLPEATVPKGESNEGQSPPDNVPEKPPAELKVENISPVASDTPQENPKPHRESESSSEKEQGGKKQEEKKEEKQPPQEIKIPRFLKLPEYSEGKFEKEELLLKLSDGQKIDAFKVLGLNLINVGDMGLTSQDYIINVRSSSFNKVAEFRCDKNMLYFKWTQLDEALDDKEKLVAVAKGLRWCIVSFKLNGKSQACSLSPPVELNQLNLNSPPPQFAAINVPEKHPLRFDGELKLADDGIAYDNVEKKDSVVTKTMNIDGIKQGSKEPFLELTIKVVKSDVGLLIEGGRRFNALRSVSNTEAEFSGWKNLVPTNLSAVRKEIEKILASANEAKNNVEKELKQVKETPENESLRNNLNATSKKAQGCIELCNRVEETLSKLSEGKKKIKPLVIIEGRIQIDYSKVEDLPSVEDFNPIVDLLVIQSKNNE